MALAIGALLILAPADLARARAAARRARRGDPASTRLRLAVLPFVNLTGDREADYLADGLTDELIAQLGRMSPKRLAVIARTSAMAYRNTDKTVAEIGQELDVSYVVEGSVRRDGTRPPRRRPISSRSSDQAQRRGATRSSGRRATSMDLQTDVAIRVARALALALVPGVAGAALPRPHAERRRVGCVSARPLLMNRGGADVRTGPRAASKPPSASTRRSPRPGPSSPKRGTCW